MLDRTTKKARLYRMVMDKHVCPYGLKAKHLLKSRGYEVEDHPLTNREETDTFKAEHDVKTTPQVFIGDQRIGGYTDLRSHFGLKNPDPDKKTYAPVIALFAMAAAMAFALSLFVEGALVTVRGAEWFVAISMCLLALQKLQDVRQFATMFLNYDLLARRWVPYGTLYPFLEGLAGVLMVGHLLTWLSVPIALTIGTIGAISVFKAVYVDNRELKCACVGGGKNVPLGFISLTENLLMIGMALWMGRTLIG